MTIEIRELAKGNKAVLSDFLNVVDLIYADDPHYVRPLDMDVSERLDERKNPFFDHGQAAAWVAYRSGQPCGRISASIDHTHLERHGDGAGFFGFFDTIDDPEVAEGLLARAAAWLVGRGMTCIRGPLSLSINEESGCLVEGFDAPPMIMMPHHLPHQGELIERAGFTKIKDLYAWRYEIGRVPPRAQKAYAEIKALPEVTTRALDISQLRADVKLMLEVYNDAWGDNWGFVPATEREVQKTADDMRLIAVPEVTRLVFIDGEVAAVALALPNVNELIHDAHGKLVPIGALKLLWRLRVRGPKSGRLMLLGIRKKWRSVRRYAGLSAYLYVALNQAAHRLGMRRAELSWTLDDNAPVNAGIRMMGGRVYKTCRIYDKAL
jgi:hypothetical protein